LVVEVDGGQHSEKVGYDGRRSAWLEAEGFRILRFWDHEVLKHIEAVKQVIGEAIDGELRTPSLVLPRKGGRKYGDGVAPERRRQM
jgi:very-short-patch-repair endonuclease